VADALLDERRSLTRSSLEAEVFRQTTISVEKVGILCNSE
jgi:hypothetical protein